MENKLLAALLPILFTTFYLSGQVDYKFGKVTKEEVAATEHHLEKDAEACFLYKNERVFYEYSTEQGFRTMRNVHYRIKIYNKSGLDWGNLSVPLYTSTSGEEEISSIKGATYNMVGGKIEETKLKKDGVFKENVNRFRNRATIAMPDVREGSVIEVSYQIASDFAGNLDDFQFQYGIPVNKVEVSVEIPQYFVFKRYGRGFYPLNVNQRRQNRSVILKGQVDRGSAYNPVSTVQSSKIEFYENVYEINVDNIPSLKQEDYTDNIDNYRSAIKFELASTQFPNSPYKNYSVSWEDVAESVYKSDSFGNELNKERLVDDLVENIKKEYSSEMELLHAIFGFVKDNITWNEYYGVYCDNGIKKTLEEKNGNVADINLLLTLMMRKAGFEANPVLVSTKSHGIPLFPTREGFNYVIGAVETSNGTLLLDATEKMASAGVLPNRVLNWQGRLVQKDGSSKPIELTPLVLAKKIAIANFNLNSDGSLEGKIRTQLTENKAFNFRNSYKDTKLEDMMESFEKQYTNIEIDELEVQNHKDCDRPLVHTYSFNQEGQLEAISNKLYFKPLFFMALNENPFKSATREYPVDFVYPQSDKISLNITLPEGYKIESMPENVNIALPDQLGRFTYLLKQQGNILQVNCLTDINRDMIPPNYYGPLKEYYNFIVNKLNERVVLVKA